MERKSENIQRAIVQELNNIMVENDQVVVVNADIALLFKDGPDSISCPDRVLDVGIAEQNMIGFASGLAYSGKTVFTTTIAEMAVARVIEQIRLDGCYPDLNINMFGQGRGFAYGIGGNSHIITEDFAMLRGIPNIKIIIPADAREARKVMHEALSVNGTKYIAISRGNTPNVYEDDYEFHIGKAVTMREGTDVTIIAVGDMVAPALDAVEILKENGINARMINMHTLKPLDNEAVIKAAKETGAILTVETHNVLGGLGSAVSEVVCEECPIPMKKMGAPDQFSTVGPMNELIAHLGLDAEHIAAEAEKLIQRK